MQLCDGKSELRIFRVTHLETKLQREIFRSIEMNYLAHIRADGCTQTVEEHLKQTARLCRGFADRFQAGDQGEYIGLAHDIGKCSEAFQNRLQGGSIVDHASAGALECARQDALWASCCVAGHHGGLPDVGNMRNDTYEDPTLFGRIRKALANGIPPYKMESPLVRVPVPHGFGTNPLTDSFIIRMLYSCLVDADYLDTESFMESGTVDREPGEPLTVLLSKLNQYIDPWWNPETEMNRKRCAILRSCIDSGSEDRGLFTLTVPTGGGKTVASMAFALNHAVRYGMDRIIYVIPYTSIIEQTAEVFRRIFGVGNVLEHHSSANYEIPVTGDAASYNNIKALENWDAPIIVTTAVQFFDSLYANRPSKCRKLHNIANSVLIFDEAQMIPTEHLRPCVASIAKMAEDFGATAVLCTATQPSLNDLFREYAPGYDIREICPGTSELYHQFRRTSFRNTGTVTAEKLGEMLSRENQVLCIVNSRKSAQMVYRLLPEDGKYHLSTLMTPMHRRETLKEIRRRLQEGKITRVVSTSLIEAGVDVDFPAVYRELAGLDSVQQAAGRCNREGKHTAEDSIVTIFDGVSDTPLMLRRNIGAAREVLGTETDPGAMETIQAYFTAYRSLSADDLDKYEVIKAFQDGWQGRMLPFRTVAEKFRLIEDESKTVYIPADGGEEYVTRLRNGEKSRDLFRKLGLYSVSVFEKPFQVLLDHGQLEALDEDSAVLINPELYRRDIGLVLEEETGTGFFV